jgi:hypothetical protein
MEVLAMLDIILIAVLVMLFVFIPSLVMIWGMSRASKNWVPYKTWWTRWASILIVLFIVPQILNLFIERDVTRLVSQSHGAIPNKVSTRILAVELYNNGKSTRFGCNQDCILLLLSGKIDQYLIVQRPPEHAHPKVTAFTFKKNSDCPFIDGFVDRPLSAKLENTVRELSLSGTCLTASDTTLDEADMFVIYDKVQDFSWLIRPSSGHQISVSQRDQNTGEWTEIYRDIKIRYSRIFPVLLPAFILDKKRSRVDVLRRTMYRSHDKKSACNQGWFSDYAPCHRQLRHRSASEILGISVSEYSLQKLGVIAAKSDRAATLSNLVKTIVSEGREPNVNEWALINRFISYEYYESDTYARLVIDVISHDNFPVPNVFFGLDKFNQEQKSRLASAIVSRIKNDVPGPEIGGSNTKQQWYNLYKTLEILSVDILEPHFEDLVYAVTKRPYNTQYVDFLGKFGSRSRQPILDLIKADKRRLRPLSPVMCKLGSSLSGIEDPLMEMAEKNQIRLNGYYGQIVYLLLDIGVEEGRILSTVNLSEMQASSQTNSIKRYLKKHKTGKTHCRR